MSTSYISKRDARYNTLKKAFNLRWPDHNNDVSEIYICNNEQDVLAAAINIHEENKRITVRSGGHCYEGFVSNNTFNGNEKEQDTVIIDIGGISGIKYKEDRGITSEYESESHNEKTQYTFKISAGNQNWDSYVNLYKISGKTIPGGSCYSVGLGGHITGGGYGLLSRKHGLIVDWLSGIDILIPDEKDTFKIIHVCKESSDDRYQRLFRACCGAGGGNFGIILNYYFKDLPDAPSTAGIIRLTYPWDKIADKNAFSKFVQAYYSWFKDNDQYWNNNDETKCNGGLFSLLKLQHISTGNIELIIQYTGKDGSYKTGVNDAPLLNFIKTMDLAANHNLFTYQSVNLSTIHGPLVPRIDQVSLSQFYDDNNNLSGLPVRIMDWLYLTQSINGSGENQYGKYKSAYQKGKFSDYSLLMMHQLLTENKGKLCVKQELIQIDSYGGCINQADKNQETSVYQRESLLKLQFQNYWKDPALSDDCVSWMQVTFHGYFNEYNGKPYEKYDGKDTPYQGCYINYPDIDMKYTDFTHKTIDPDWLALYYGEKISKELIEVKNIFDRDNIFRHEMSIPLK
ncbi:BBE domain-containing protein [Xenorhabdus sp. PB30.3]|uniref:BBE domain-containing protein n=1 Tax=Xenorhabdus sp. PB30.3 TaxID=2788941 RepID=UPI001E49A0BD|nr:BBE domain-containing protein [Xenorhabdus sp. PB30.3]MCC8378396.1 BBE domain-containing protein [Xenorhabdus sp. PB30.3]